MSEESIGSILKRVGQGGRMSFDDGLRVYEEASTCELAQAASDVRLIHVPVARSEVTYLVDRNVNYTNVCITDCKFCEFYRPPGHRDAYVLPREVIASKLSELVNVGGSRVLLQGGHHPDLRISWYEDLLRFIKSEFPSLEIDAFSPSEIENLAALESMSLEETVTRLKAAGLGGIPGGGGEILDDEIRHIVSPKKTKTATWLRVMEIAHQLGLYTSASQVFGFGEAPVHRVRALERLRVQQDHSRAAYGLGFLAFIAWPLQYESRYGEVFGRLKGWKLGGDAEDYLRHIAFCRVYLDNFPHFQASWPTMGLETALRALDHGCDDLGGTMMEENVVSKAGSVHCSQDEASLRARLVSLGRVPRKRDSWYRSAEPEPAQAS